MKPQKKYYVIDLNYDTMFQEFTSKKEALDFIKYELKRDSGLDPLQIRVIEGYDLFINVKVDVIVEFVDET